MSASMGDLMEAVAGESVANVKTWLPGEVVSYDPRTRLALVKTKVRIIKTGDDGEPVGKKIPQAWMFVPLFESGGFVFGADVEKGDRGRICYSHAALEEFKKDGKEHDVWAGKFDETDAVFVPGGADLAHPGVEVPRGQMIMGAADGPRVTWDRTSQVVTTSCVNEVRVLGGAMVRIESRGDVFIQGRRVNPLGGDI